MLNFQYVFLLGFLISSGICYAADQTFTPPASAPQLVVTSLPDNIKNITGQGFAGSYGSRLKEIHALPNELPADHCDALIGFLRVPLAAQSEPALSNLEYNALKNELFIALMMQREKPSFGIPLIEMYLDPDMDITWRDYCVQFMGQWYFLEPDSKVREKMLETLYQALEDRSTGIAGTAITAIAIIHDKSQMGPEKLQAAVRTILSADDANELTLISVLDVGRQLKMPEALIYARTVLKGAQTQDKVLVMAAIATIGDLGNRSDLPQLQPFADSYDSRMRIPANNAIRKIK